MTRALSLETVEATLAEQAPEEFVALITLKHPTLDGDMHINTSGQVLTSNGVTYHPLPVDITLPSQDPEAPPRTQLRIDNVDREMGITARRMDTAATVDTRIVRLDAPDVVEMEYPDYTLRNVSVDMLQVTGDLTLEEYADEPFPCDTFTPSFFPAI